jgi:hypothetical protein
VNTEKYLLALKCLLAAHSIDPEQAKLHEQLIRFRLASPYNLNHSSARLLTYRTVDALPESLPEKVNQILQSLSGKIVPPKSSLSSFNDKYLTAHRDCARRTQSALNVRLILDESTKSANEKDLIKTLELRDIDMQEAVEGLELLKEWSSEDSVKEQYTSAARKRWPQATIFASS